jgi:bifunctional non-homologous end joining protein LigD
MAQASSVEVAGVTITHPDKLLWPDDGISKLDLARYYAAAAPVMLRYVKDRPLTLRPFPRGVNQPGFFRKDAPRGAPAWIKTFEDVAESTSQPVHFIVATDARTLVWLAQMNAVEVHPWLARTDKPDVPDWAVLDLDPPDDTPWSLVVHAAHLVRERLAGLDLQSFPKLSGQSGLHLLVPLARRHPFDEVREVLGALAAELARAHADVLTDDYVVAERGGRVLMDYAQNARAKNTVAPYSVRPKPHAPVAMPLTWAELENPSIGPGAFSIADALRRLETVGDVLEPALALKQRLPAKLPPARR